MVDRRKGARRVHLAARTAAAGLILCIALAAPAAAGNMRGDDQPKDRPGQSWHNGGHDSRGEDWQKSWRGAVLPPPVVYVPDRYAPPPVVYAPPVIVAVPGIAVTAR